ncbi:MAG: hypothetical protein H8Z69_03895 [Nanohaloarchaea archaeon]|nr:hypothetical protein [Candidatus Nanohaloarchaea archaeon]
MKVKKPAFMLLFFIALISGGLAQSSNSSSSFEDSSIISIDETTKIVNTTWGSNGVKIVFDSEIPKLISITDVNSISSTGASTVNFKRTRLSPGMTTVRMDLTMKRGDMKAIIGSGKTFVSISNPSKPLLSNITRLDFYLEGLMVAVFTSLQVVWRHKWYYYRLKKGLNRVI